LYEHIVKYLRDKAAPASASEIVNRVLKIQGSDEGTAGKILKPFIENANDIYITGNGLFALKDKDQQPGHEAEHEDDNVVFCNIIPSTCRSVSQWTSLQLVLYRQNKQADTYKHPENTPVPAMNTAQLAAHFVRIRKFIRDYPIVFDGFGNQISLFKSGMLKLTGRELKNPVISLYRLAKRVFPDNKIQDPAHLSQLLGGRGYKEANPEVQMTSLVEQFFSLRQLCFDRDVKSLNGLIEFQEVQKINVDYSGYAFDDSFLENLPSAPGVYIMKNKGGEVIYVGKSKNLYSRLNSYFTGLEKLEKKLEKIRYEIHDIETILTGSELEALLLEQELIDEYKPPINRQVKVHERIKKERYIYKRILFLPSATAETIILYLIDPQTGLSILKLRHDCANIELIKEKITLFFGSDKKDHNDKRLDIIASWLYHNEDQVNSIDIRKYANPDDVIRLIKDYAKSLADDFSRVIHY